MGWYRRLQVGCQQAQNLRNAYQNISIHLNKQFYSSNWPITTMPRVFCICNLTTNLQSSVLGHGMSQGLHFLKTVDIEGPASDCARIRKGDEAKVVQVSM